MAGYRDTLNLPDTAFPMKADLATREPARLAWWADLGFEAERRRRRAGRPVWLLHDGPPYSNNHIHMGTAANKIWKDACVRMATLLGYDAPYVPGWDNHGMPIETEVSKELRRDGATLDRLELRRRCRAYAETWIGIQREEFRRLGVHGTWDEPYLTMSREFEAAIVEAFAALAARGFVQRGQRSIHWCPTDRTALAEAEIEYHDDESPSIHVPFPLRRDPRGVLGGRAVEAVAWTTTPWTLPANLGLMVDPGADYVLAGFGDRTLLVAAARRAAVAAALGAKDLPVIAGLRGADLLGLVFEGPWGGDSRVVDGAPHVSLEDGTGLVHTAPGHGKEDFAVGQRAGLGVLCPVDEAGRFTAGAEPFVGRSVLEVNADILAWLGERGRLLAATTLTHAYPHCWRCRRPVIFRATDQWFMIVDHDGHRDRALAEIEGVSWDPPASKNRIRESVRGRPDWCLSRQRSWGVGIPAVYCDACGHAALDPGVMSRAAELTRAHGSDAWFERPVAAVLPAGFRCPACGGDGPFRKETDILDVWFDSGCTHRVVRAAHGLEEAWQRARTGAGGQKVVYLEGPDQHRGWFNSSLMVAVGIDRRAPYTDVLTHGWVLDATGRAMHKSLGNVIAPADIVKRHGADVVRWWALATDWRGDVRIGDEILQRVADAYRKVRNTFRFLLGNLAGFGPGDALPAAALRHVDRAFLGHLDHELALMRRDWERLEFHRALDRLLNVCTVDLSAVFLDVAKDRLYTLAPLDPARRSAQTALWRALRGLTVASAPALVFTAEEAWQHHPALVAESPSVHLAEWTAAAPDPRAAAEWERMLALRAAVNAAIEPLRAAKTLATTLEAEVALGAEVADPTWLEGWQEELAGFLMVAKVTAAAATPGVAVTRTAWARCARCWTHRADVAAGGDLCARCDAVLRAGRAAAGQAGPGSSGSSA